MLPAATLTLPIDEPTPVSVRVPLPAWVSAPVPLSTPAKLVGSERSNTSVALSSTLPAMLPVVPPLPTCKVPALMVVPPV